MKKLNPALYPHLTIAVCALPALIISGCASNLETAYVKEGDEIIAIDETTVQENNMATLTLEVPESSETLPIQEESNEENVTVVEEEIPVEETHPVIIATGNSEAYVLTNAEDLAEGGNSLHSLDPSTSEFEDITATRHEKDEAVSILENATTAPPSQHTTVLFASNSAEISGEDMDRLVKHAEYLLNTPEAVLVINGHSVNRGKLEYNLLLSEKRAQSVANVLLNMGVSKNQLAINAFGDTVPTLDPSNWQANRRVELNYESANILSQR